MVITNRTPCIPPAASPVNFAMPPSGRGQSETLGILRSIVSAHGDAELAVSAYVALAVEFAGVAS